jgi:hypothetical protein
MFGAISLDRKQLFCQYNRFDDNTFYEFLKQLHYKFPKCYLFLDKASQHYKSHRVRQYLEKHNDVLIPVWLPTASPEFMVLEESWNISKKERSAGTNVLSLIHKFQEENRTIFQNKTFQSGYEKLSG